MSDSNPIAVNRPSGAIAFVRSVNYLKSTAINASLTQFFLLLLLRPLAFLSLPTFPFLPGEWVGLTKGGKKKGGRKETGRKGERERRKKDRIDETARRAERPRWHPMLLARRIARELLPYYYAQNDSLLSLLFHIFCASSRLRNRRKAKKPTKLI